MIRKEADFEAFERVMLETHGRQPISVLCYCVMSNRRKFMEAKGIGFPGAIRI
jgi:hypothetical protein